VTRKVFTTYILTQEQMQSMLAQAKMDHSEISAFQPTAQTPVPQEMEMPAPKGTTVTSEFKVGRNDLCPCGSGKKYKKCCGKMENMFQDE
jgi:preprotein translocase subunit SecA